MIYMKVHCIRLTDVGRQSTPSKYRQRCTYSLFDTNSVKWQYKNIKNQYFQKTKSMIFQNNLW